MGKVRVRWRAAILYFMDRHYWISAVRAMARHPRAVLGAGLRAETEITLPIVGILDAYPQVENVPVEMGTIRYRHSNLLPEAQFSLAAMARVLKPGRVFEIGTYDGATTMLLARNSDAEILTLDLPPDTAGAATVKDEVENATAGAGSRLRGTPEEARITQLLGDSRTFDFSPWHGTVDLVFIDGGHEYDTVRADTINALKLRSPNGIIVWDDCSLAWPGVIQAINETAPEAFRFHRTDLAIFDPADPAGLRIR